MNYLEFSKKIKEKYPQYSDVDDKELAEKIIAKYPEYSDITFDIEPGKQEGVQPVAATVAPKEPKQQPILSEDSGKKPEVSFGEKMVRIDNNVYSFDEIKESKAYKDKDFTSVEDYVKKFGTRAEYIAPIDVTADLPTEEEATTPEAKEKAKSKRLALDANKKVKSVNETTPEIQSGLIASIQKEVDTKSGRLFQKGFGDISADGYKPAPVIAEPTEEELKEYLGEDKFNIYNQYQKGKDIDMGLAQKQFPGLISNLIKEEKNRVASNYQTSLTPEERGLMNRYIGEDIDSEYAKQEKKREQDEKDYFELTGRVLNGTKVLNNRKFEPSTQSMLKMGLIDEVPVDTKNAWIENQTTKMKVDKELLSEDVNAFEEKAKEFDSLYGSKISRLNELGNALETFGAPEKDVESYNLMVGEFEAIRSDLNAANISELNTQLVVEQDAIRQKSLALSEQAGLVDNVQILANATSKNYDNIDRTLLMMEKSFGGAGAMLGAGLLKGTVDALKAVDTPFTNSVDRLYQDAVDYNKEIDNEIQGLSRTIKLEDVGDDVEAVDYIFQMLANNSPSISAALATGPLSGLGVPAQVAKNLLTATFFTMEGGSKLSDLEIAQSNSPKVLAELEQRYENAKAPAERKLIEQEISAQQDLLNAGMLKKMFVATAYGTVASFAERFGTLSYVNNVNRFLNVSRGNVLQKGLKQIGNIGFNAGTELVEEGFTQLTHNFIDIAAMGEDKSIFEGLDQDFVANVVLSSGAIQGPSVSMNLTGYMTEELSSIDDKKEFIKKRNKLMDLDISLRELDENGEKVLKGAARQNILNERLALSKDVMIDFGVLLNDGLIGSGITEQKLRGTLAAGRRTGDYSQFYEMTDLAWKKRKVLKEINKHELEGGDSDADINYGDKLQEEYRKLNERHSRLASAKKRAEIEELQKGYTNENGDVIPYPDIAQRQRSLAIFRLNRDIAKNTIENAKTKKGVKKPKYVEFSFNEITSNKKLSEDEKEAAIRTKINNWATQNNYSTAFARDIFNEWKTGSNGAYGLNTAIVFADTIADQIYNAEVSDLDSRIAAVSPVHELLHAYNKSNNITDEGILKSMDNAYKSLNDFVEEKFKQGAISPATYEFYNQRRVRYSESNNKNEELVNLVNDLIAAKVLSRNQFTELFQLRTAINKINNFFIGEAYDYSFIETGEDLFNYISTFQKVTKDQSLKMVGTPEEQDEEDFRRSVGEYIELTDEETEKLNEAVTRANTAYLEDKRDNRDVREAKAEALSLVEGDLYGTTEVLFDIYSEKVDGKFEIAEDKAVEIAYNWDNEIQRRLKNSSDARFEYYRNSPAFDEEIIESIASTTIMGSESRPSQSIKGLIETYDGSVPINAFINKYINNKIVDVINSSFPVLAGKEARTDETIEKYARAFREEAAETSFEEEDISAGAEEYRKNKINATPGLIDPREILPANLLEQSENAVKPQIEELDLETLTLKTLLDLSTDITAKFFSVRERTLYEKKLNLNRGEMNAAQSIFRDIGFQKLIDLLPFATVPMVAGGDRKITQAEAEARISSELIGTSTGVPTNLMKKFYDQVGRVKTPAGLPERVKKEDLTPEYMAETLGMDVDGKVVNNDPRSPTGQNIKGMMELVGRLITNKIVREELADVPEYQVYVANIYAGASPLMASLTTYEYDYREILEIDVNEEFLKQYPGSKKSLDFGNKLQLQSARDAKKMLVNSFSPEDVIKYILPTVSNQYGLVSGLFVEDKKGNLINAFKEIVSDLEKVTKKRTRYFLTQGRADFFKNFFKDAQYTKGAKEVTIDGKTYPTVPNSFANRQNAKGFLSGEFEKNLGARFQFNENQRQGLEEIVNKLKELLEEGKISANDVGMVMMTFNSSTNALVRTAALPSFYASLESEQKEGLTDADFDYEHTKPARVVIGQLLEYIANKNVTFKSIMDDYNAAIILEPQHKAVNKYHKTSLPIIGAEKRYDHPELVEFLNKENIPLINLTEFKGIAELKANAAAVVNSNRKALLKAKQDTRIEVLNQSKGSELSNNELLTEFAQIDNQRINKNIKASKGADLSKKFNIILQKKHGVAFNKKISTAEARLASKRKANYSFWIPPSADDFAGLLYYTLGKGKEGEEAMAFYKEKLFDPFSIGERAIDSRIVQMSSDYKQLQKDLKVRPDYVNKKNPTGFTNEQSMRIWMFHKGGHKIPGLTDKMLKENLAHINKDPSLLALAKGIIKLTKLKEYTKPSDNWVGGTVANDMFNLSRGEIRTKYLEEWQANADEIFTEENLNKLETLYGLSYRNSLQDSLRRMKEGRNRKSKPGDYTDMVFDYLNGSTATIMFFNTRSALLQLISNINFINWSDNNPLMAGKAFSNQKQYWKDLYRLWNSDYLVARRGGLKINISESELSDIARSSSKNKISKLIATLLKNGYIPTQFADSIAITTGGATFYRNRLNRYLKEGLSKKEAEEKAFNEFRDISEESQQSARPDKISMQQASGIGRLILNFANTPMQYARISKKAALDLLNNRGDWKTNISKILYYTFIQNLIFNLISNAVWALMFGNDEPEDEAIYEKNIDLANGMANGIMRGLGIYGATAAMVKDVALKLYKENRKSKLGGRGQYKKAAQEILNVIPPVDSKLSKLSSAFAAADRGAYNDMFEEDFTLDAPYLLPTAKVFSGVLNLPLDRVYTKYKNLEGAMNSDLETWQRVALVAGFQDWQLGFDASKETFKPADYDKALQRYLKGGASKSTSKSKDYEKALEKYLSR